MTRWILVGFLLLLAAAGRQENPLAYTEWQLVALGDAGAPAAVAGGSPPAGFTSLAAAEYPD